jgi:hypothetical protein
MHEEVVEHLTIELVVEEATAEGEVRASLT